ncbi:MAG TPA: outer membrane lipid asymmetry maintenance protein MlaD [Pseudomonadales bacterium]
MRMRTIEISVGAFVLAGILAVVVLVVKVSGVSLSGSADAHLLKAEFPDVAGLRVRAKVSMAGVTIGRVSQIDVDPEYGVAIVTMEINDRIWPLPQDTGARILTEGLLGARYVALTPGADTEMLKEGDFITDTQGALVLENLIGDFITRLGGS